MSNKVLVTGAAGFIGFHTIEKLLSEGFQVVGLDNINDYYTPQLKYDRLKESGILQEEVEWNFLAQSVKHENYRFIRMEIENKQQLSDLFQNEHFNYVIHLAAQAGVRYSIQNPDAYIQSNIVGFANILECCRHNPVKKLLYASSSSVYGNSVDTPFSTDQRVDNPISLYAATKKSNELMAYTYSHLYNIETIGLRFFTVYGPWGRPDMAMFLFTDAILNDKPINVFNNGDLSRDFTYVDDIVQGILLIVAAEEAKSEKYQLFNIGNSRPIQLLQFIQEIENEVGKEAEKVMLPMQAGDVNQTWANVDGLKERYGYNPRFTVREGVKNFVNWYKNYYHIA